MSRLTVALDRFPWLKTARAVGLEIPRTLVTNDPASVRAFAAECREGLITKMLSSFAIMKDGTEKVVFTSLVSPEDLDDLELSSGERLLLEKDLGGGGLRLAERR